MKLFRIDTVFNFGMYLGKSIDEVLKKEPLYIGWCIENLNHFVLDPDIIKNNNDTNALFSEKVIGTNKKKYGNLIDDMAFEPNVYDDSEEEEDYKHPSSSEYYDDNLDWDQQSSDFWDDIT